METERYSGKRGERRRQKRDGSGLFFLKKTKMTPRRHGGIKYHKDGRETPSVAAAAAEQGGRGTASAAAAAAAAAEGG
jgi:hypothetical protein